ncbi:GNAT family N-acetyltransferase [Dissulfurirhabdus thermomarina]|uniref:GNAT family N-acetyltransferase n=1 Tax=Dissulfurirhabdus thermomarina TaxID=1765737 RepID=A0A6N9TMN1_DISTH|nr:GNAT family N-acetyltransferase [Dissulfurirhabdus thermomarina]NDY42389.1 GNAT family N-acetyltransferase [Dissulfurirhabdus thermomarina]NMX24309.1 GNAT family N-acetyltransferase [Dissulfurirhabdus thermomarina]
MAAEPLPGVIILYNRPGENAPESDRGVLDEVEAVARALAGKGFRVRTAPADRLEEVLPLLQAGQEPVVFNLVESFPGRPEDAVHVPSICRALGRGCTGSETACLALTLDKAWTRGALAEAGIPVPPGVVVPPGTQADGARLPRGPLLVKPVRADASEGIRADESVVDGPGRRLDDAIGAVHERFGQPALVEALVGDRELNVSVVDLGGGPVVLPLAEIDFSRLPEGTPRVVDYSAKWEEDSFAFHNTPRILPAPLDEGTAALVRRTALAAFRATGARGYARVDMRLESATGALFVLEVNANPDISPEAGFAAALEAGEIPYADFVAAMVRTSMKAAPGSLPAGHSAALPTAPLSLREAVKGDQEAVMDILYEAGVFRPEECLVGREVFEDAISRGAASGYHSLVAEDGIGVCGWICHGPTPCTVGTHDVYWLVTARRARRRGVASALLAEAERRIAGQGGRLVVVETSSSPPYAPARAFYLAHGFREEALVRDFYLAGDHRVILTKRLSP